MGDKSSSRTWIYGLAALLLVAVVGAVLWTTDALPVWPIPFDGGGHVMESQAHRDVVGEEYVGGLNGQRSWDEMISFDDATIVWRPRV